LASLALNIFPHRRSDTLLLCALQIINAHLKKTTLMHKLTFITLLIFIIGSHTASFAQCHHTIHVHHSSGHVHARTGSHTHYHSHYSSHYHSHDRGSSSGYYWNRSNGGDSHSIYGFRFDVPLRGTNEITAAAGAESSWQLNDKDVTVATPNYFGTYRYYITNGLALGISVGTQTTSGKDTCNCTVPGTQPGKGPLYDFSTRTITVGAELTWVIASEQFFQVYQGLGAGVSFFDEHDTYPDKTTSSLTGIRYVGQVTLGGLRFGRALGAYVEIGYGYKGIVNGGLSYQAGHRKSHKFG
jgi:hypothetical protein